MSSAVLIEAKSSYEKKYKCPYCNERHSRQTLAHHIERHHASMIPEGYTPLRVAFNAINNKTQGYCIICRQPTAWNETKGRYERLCGREECKQAYLKMYKSRVRAVYGTDKLSSDPRYKEMIEKKALAGRKISGYYTFKDGGKKSYVGSYEKNFLEFMDKVMNIESIDLESPGPSIIYQFNGKSHLYISDFLYVPYNLIIEIKDRGDYPRGESRDKDIAKRKAVIENSTYNYLCVKDNDFSKLMQAFAVMKYKLSENDNDRLIMENMSGVIGSAIAPWPIPYEANPDNYYMIQHLQNNVFNYSITKDPTQSEVIGIDAEKGYTVHSMNKKDIPGSYIVFKLKDRDKAHDVYREALSLLGAKVNSTEYFYQKYTGRRILTEDQILYDDKFERILTFEQEIDNLNESLYEYLTKTSSMDLLDEQVKALEALNSLEE